MRDATENPKVTRVLVISPHLDDGVFSCGDLLAGHPGSAVVTALAGRPPDSAALTGWDGCSRFRRTDDSVLARRRENWKALNVLAARPIWLNFCDADKDLSPNKLVLANALDRAIQEVRAKAVFAPAGLFHRDHQLTHEAALLAHFRHLGLSWFLYEDDLHRMSLVDMSRHRLEWLREAGFSVRPVHLNRNNSSPLKQKAIAFYQSVKTSVTLASAKKPERYWRVSA